MIKFKKHILFNICICILLTSCKKHLPPEPIADIPVQTTLETPLLLKEEKDYKIYALAEFEIKARVLGVENYSLGQESDFSPVDFVLGWKKMSQPSILSKIQISQSGRFYFWKTQDQAIYAQQKEISTQSANMHIVPSDKNTKKMLKKVEPNTNVYLKGYLIKIQKTSGWHWVSSLTRDDIGAGACELVWVTQVIPEIQ